MSHSVTSFESCCKHDAKDTVSVVQSSGSSSTSCDHSSLKGDQPGNYQAKSGETSEQEPASHYHVGGYHPVTIGDRMNSDRYFIIRKIGWDEVSIKWLARDIPQQQYVCIRIYKSSEPHAEQANTFIENALKLQSKRCDTIIYLLDHFKIKGINGSHVCTVTQVMAECLSNYMIRQSFQPISIGATKTIIRQILQALNFLHTTHGLVHAGINPESIMFRADKNYQLLLALEAYHGLKQFELPCACKSNLPDRLKHIETIRIFKYPYIRREWLNIDTDLMENVGIEDRDSWDETPHYISQMMIHCFQEVLSQKKYAVSKCKLTELVKQMLASKMIDLREYKLNFNNSPSKTKQHTHNNASSDSFNRNIVTSNEKKNKKLPLILSRSESYEFDSETKISSQSQNVSARSSSRNLNLKSNESNSNFRTVQLSNECLDETLESLSLQTVSSKSENNINEMKSNRKPNTGKENYAEDKYCEISLHRSIELMVNESVTKTLDTLFDEESHETMKNCREQIVIVGEHENIMYLQNTNNCPDEITQRQKEIKKRLRLGDSHENIKHNKKNIQVEDGKLRLDKSLQSSNSTHIDMKQTEEKRREDFNSNEFTTIQDDKNFQLEATEKDDTNQEFSYEDGKLANNSDTNDPFVGSNTIKLDKPYIEYTENDNHELLESNIVDFVASKSDSNKHFEESTDKDSSEESTSKATDSKSFDEERLSDQQIECASELYVSSTERHSNITNEPLTKNESSHESKRQEGACKCTNCQGENKSDETSSCSTSTSTQESYSEFLLSYCKHNTMCSTMTRMVANHYNTDQQTQIVIVDLENVKSANDTSLRREDIQRQYKAIELILGKNYDEKIDIWSVACLTFELVTGDFLFNPRESKYYTLDEHHILKTIQLIGSIPTNLILDSENSIRNLKTELERDRKYIKNINAKDNIQRILTKIYKMSKGDAKQLAKFMIPMLNLDPSKRVTAEKCLHNKWLSN